MTEYISKQSIIKLARRAGIKNIADDCIPIIRNLIGIKLHDIINTTVIVNSGNGTKTIMENDIYKAFEIMDIKVSKLNTK